MPGDYKNFNAQLNRAIFNVLTFMSMINKISEKYFFQHFSLKFHAQLS